MARHAQVRVLVFICVLSLSAGCTSQPDNAEADSELKTSIPSASPEESPSNIWRRIDPANAGNGELIVGLKQQSLAATEPIAEYEYKELADAVTAGIAEGLSAVDGTGRIPLPGGTPSNTMIVKAGSESAIEDLLASPLVEYVEPAVVDVQTQDFLSCGADTWQAQSHPRATDRRLGHRSGEPGDLLPYNYAFHSVAEAWEHLPNGELPGSGIGIAVLDTGVSEAQEQFSLRYDFDTRAPMLKLNETRETSDDVCSHGTKMASVAAAPRDFRSIVGIAFASDLMSIKVTETPHANKSTVSAICSGIEHAVRPPDGRPSARVVAMAFGLTYYSPTIAACIESAYRAAPNLIFVAAAGSTVPEVIFPASLDCCVLAASMIELQDSGYRLMARPGTVAYGPSVDFVSASTIGGIPAAGLRGSAHVDEIAKFSWSSAATATYAGLIAVASQYARSQGWSRQELLTVLGKCSSRAGISDFSGEPTQAIVGAGVLDLYCATGGARELQIAGRTEVPQGARLVLKAHPNDGRPPERPAPSHFTYAWTIDGVRIDDRSPSMMIDSTNVGSHVVGLELTDTLDGKVLTAEKTVYVTEPSDTQSIGFRELTWTGSVADWATFLNGGRHDRVVNAGVRLPSGCQIRDAFGLLVGADGVPEPDQRPSHSVDLGSHGFTIERDTTRAAEDLEVVIHQWHDAFSAVRTTVVYHIYEDRGASCEIPGILTDGTADNPPPSTLPPADNPPPSTLPPPDNPPPSTLPPADNPPPSTLPPPDNPPPPVTEPPICEKKPHLPQCGGQ